MPVVGEVGTPLSDAMNDTRAKPDVAEVGYYFCGHFDAPSSHRTLIGKDKTIDRFFEYPSPAMSQRQPASAPSSPSTKRA
jgi:hypothetical protein